MPLIVGEDRHVQQRAEVPLSGDDTVKGIPNLDCFDRGIGYLHKEKSPRKVDKEQVQSKSALCCSPRSCQSHCSSRKSLNGKCSNQASKGRHPCSKESSARLCKGLLRSSSSSRERLASRGASRAKKIGNRSFSGSPMGSREASRKKLSSSHSSRSGLSSGGTLSRPSTRGRSDCFKSPASKKREKCGRHTTEERLLLASGVLEKLLSKQEKRVQDDDGAKIAARPSSKDTGIDWSRARPTSKGAQESCCQEPGTLSLTNSWRPSSGSLRSQSPPAFPALPPAVPAAFAASRVRPLTEKTMHTNYVQADFGAQTLPARLDFTEDESSTYVSSCARPSSSAGRLRRSATDALVSENASHPHQLSVNASKGFRLNWLPKMIPWKAVKRARQSQRSKFDAAASLNSLGFHLLPSKSKSLKKIVPAEAPVETKMKSEALAAAAGSGAASGAACGAAAGAATPTAGGVVSTAAPTTDVAVQPASVAQEREPEGSPSPNPERPQATNEEEPVAANSETGAATPSGPTLRRSRRKSTRLNRQSTLHLISMVSSPDSNATEVSRRKSRTPSVRLQKEDQVWLWMGVFHRVKFDGLVHRDDLKKGLELIGVPSPQQDWIDEIVVNITEFVTLSEDEFVSFVRLYMLQQSKAYEEAFEKCDSNGSGTIEAHELGELLRTFGIEPMAHVLQEVIAEVDTQRNGTLDLQEFEGVMHILQRRQGFTLREYEELMKVFNKFDRDGSSEINTNELMGVLGWLGYSAAMKDAAEVVQTVDVDGSGSLNKREFLMCMRKVREMELCVITDMIERSDKDKDGTISSQELLALVTELGYPMADAESVADAARDARIKPADNNLDLSQIWQFLGVFRQREGFSGKEAEEIRELFSRYDRDETGELGPFQTGQLLRWLGYALTFEVLQQWISKVDLDDSGSLGLSEVFKMVRMLRERDFMAIRQAFENQRPIKGILSHVKVRLAFDELKAVDAHGRPPQVPSDDTVDGMSLDLEGFTRIMLRFNKEVRESFKRNGGFSVAEVQELMETFKTFDKDGSGGIRKNEMVGLIESTMPTLARSKEKRPMLVSVMKEVDQDGDGQVSFSEFLVMMQHLQQLQDAERTQKEQTAIKETGFSNVEVCEFRELFLANSNGEHQLHFHGVRKMIDMITPLGDRLMHQLKKIIQRIREASAPIGSSANGLETPSAMDGVDFPDFLRLMRRLLDMNFANIQEKTARSGQGP